MCRKIMDTSTSKFINSDYLKPGSKPRWSPFHVSAENGTPIRKCSCRKRRRSQKAKHAALTETETPFGFIQQEKLESGCRACAACQQLPAGAMAPRNTTQYLMSNVYEDEKIDETQPFPPESSAHIYCESLSPRSVSAALDSYYDAILAHQLRDFEQLFGLTWKPE